jgi:dipeptidase
METKGCYMMAAGKEATADGSVLVARSCDATGGDDVVQVLAVPGKRHEPGETIRIPGAEEVVLPQVSETFAYLGIMMVTEGADIAEAEGGVNEHQVVAGTSTGGWLNPEAQKKCPTMPTSVGDYRMTLVLERCKTAREGVELVGKLTDEYGARTDNYIIGDPNEAWFYEEYRGNLWAAVRVPDDCFVVQANSVRIDRVDFDDPDNFLGSENLVSFAVENGMYDSDSGEPFNPSKVYGAQTGKVRHGIPAPEYDRRRIWRGISLLAPSTSPDPEEPTWTYPLFVRPDEKLTPKDFLALFTDHYQGTEYDIYGVHKHEYNPTVSPMIATDPTREYKESPFQINERRQYQLAPIWGTERIIGTARSVTNWCAQLRGWMPDPVGGLIWAGIGEGATAGRIPWYSGITKTPKPYTIGTRPSRLDRDPQAYNLYDERSAYWSFRVVTNLVNLFYTATKDEVIPAWREWEEKNFRLQPAVEKVALELYEEDPDLAVEFLTTYSCSKAGEALGMAREMTVRLHSIISHYNAPL